MMDIFKSFKNFFQRGGIVPVKSHCDECHFANKNNLGIKIMLDECFYCPQIAKEIKKVNKQ